MKRHSGFTAAALLCAFSAPACAADAPSASPLPALAEGWIVTLSVMGAVAPSFPGSAQLRPYPFPSVAIRRIDEPERFSAPDDGFGFALVDYNDFRAGPVANFVFPRGRRDGLFGLKEIGTTHEIGGFVEIAPADFLRARAELRQGVDGHQGFVAAFGADAHGALGPVRASFGPRLSFGDNNYANAYYSVSPAEALMNGRLRPYVAGSGFTAVGGLATLRYDFGESASVTVFGGAQRLLGSVGSSPIPALIGSRNQYTAGLSISRSFAIKASEIPTPW